MNHQAAADAYLESRVLTAAPYQLHLLVVEAALRHARKAQEALQQRDFEVSYFGLTKARECLDELITGLNSEPLPDLSEGMKQLFLFVHRCFRLADLTHETKHIADGLRVLEMHRDNWLLAIERAAQERAALEPQSAPVSTPQPVTHQSAGSSDEPRPSLSLFS